MPGKLINMATLMYIMYSVSLQVNRAAMHNSSVYRGRPSCYATRYVGKKNPVLFFKTRTTFYFKGYSDLHENFIHL